MKILTKVQEALIQILKDTQEDPLTVRELQDRLAISSPSVVHHHIQQLEKKGYLRRNPSNTKDYQVLTDSPEKTITYLNLYGLAKCGPEGILASSTPIDRIPVATRILGFASADGFLIKAKGDSMEPKISDGDLVIAKRTQNATTGDIVVCSHNGHAKIKKISLSKPNKSIILISLNPKYEPEIVSEADLAIEGIVKGVIATL